MERHYTSVVSTKSFHFIICPLRFFRFDRRGRRWYSGQVLENHESRRMSSHSPLKPTSRHDSLRERDELTTRLIEGSPDCLKVLDLDGRLLSMNAGGMKALEICDLAPVLSSLWTDFWEGPDRQAAQAAVNAAREGGVG